VNQWIFPGCCPWQRAATFAVHVSGPLDGDRDMLPFSGSVNDLTTVTEGDLMSWFRRNKNAQNVSSAKSSGDAALFAGLRRGTTVSPRATVQRHYSTEDVIERLGLKGDPRRPGGEILLGVAGGEIKEARDSNGRSRRYVSGGTFIVSNDNRHVFTVAGSRAGKSVSLMLPNCLRFSGSILVVDPKGDLARESCHHRAKALRQKVYVLDPYGVSGDRTLPFRATFNPLKCVDGIKDVDKLLDIASIIADSLVVRSAAASDPHWDEASRAFLEAVILHVITAPQYRNRRTLGMVRKILMDLASCPGLDGLPKLAEEMMENTAADGLVIAGARAQYERSEREADGVLSSTRRHSHFLSYPRIQRVLEDGELDLAQALMEPTTIYLCLPATKMGICAGWLRLFVNLFLAALEENPDRHAFQTQSATKPEFLMVLDEFPVLGYLKRIEDACGQIAGLGCKLWPVVQDLGQLKAIYSHRWESFLGNAGVVTFWGNMDLFTLEYLQKRLGPTQIVTPSQGQTTLDAAIERGASGGSFNISSHPFMTVPEIAATFGREDPQLRMLALISTLGPVIVQRCSYFDHPILKEMHVHG
jgi:type IV secretion system protein VirD4